jgi:hypothetical protein
MSVREPPLTFTLLYTREGGDVMTGVLREKCMNSVKACYATYL